MNCSRNPYGFFDLMFKFFCTLIQRGAEKLSVSFSIEILIFDYLVRFWEMLWAENFFLIIYYQQLYFFFKYQIHILSVIIFLYFLHYIIWFHSIFIIINIVYMFICFAFRHLRKINIGNTQWMLEIPTWIIYQVKTCQI